MIKWLSGPELIVVLVIVVLLFGVGRIGKIFTELGKGLREFSLFDGRQGRELCRGHSSLPSASMKAYFNHSSSPR